MTNLLKLVATMAMLINLVTFMLIVEHSIQTDNFRVYNGIIEVVLNSERPHFNQKLK